MVEDSPDVVNALEESHSWSVVEIEGNEVDGREE